MPITVKHLKDTIKDLPDDTIVFVHTKDNWSWTSKVDTIFRKISENEHHLYIEGHEPYPIR